MEFSEFRSFLCHCTAFYVIYFVLHYYLAEVENRAIN